jgi:hypothetical protein
MVFHSVKDAVANGFQICDRTADGYLARIKTTHGWALALVEMRDVAECADPRPTARRT